MRYGRNPGDYNKYGTLIAVRAESAEVQARNGFYPELLQHVVVGDISVVTVHVPNGSGFGWEKIDHL